MNLTSRRARRALAAVCSTAVVAAGGAFFVAPAHAAGMTLAFGPTATSATITDLDPTVSSMNAVTAYGLKVTGAIAADPDPLRLSVLTGPIGGSVSMERRSGNGTPTNATGAYTALTTTTATATAATDSAITVVSSTGFVVGHAVAIVGTTGNTEYAIVGSIGGGTNVTLTSRVVNTHAIGSKIYDIGPVRATTTTASNPGVSDTALVLTSASGMAVGDWLFVGGISVATAEYRRITAISGNTVTVLAISATDADHVSGGSVIDVGPGTEVGTANTVADTSLTVATTVGFAVGDNIFIGGATPETATVTAITSGTVLALAAPLTSVHALASAVFVVGSTASGWTSTAVATSKQVPAYSTSTNSDSVYLASTAPGTYTLQFFKDRNGNFTYDAGQDDATPVFTLSVKDVNGTTSSDTGDDLAPALTVASATDMGQKITPTVTTGLTYVDTRGSTAGVGVLGSQIAAASTFTFADVTGVTGVAAGAAPANFDGTSLYLASANSSGAGTASTTFAIGSAITRASTTTFAASTAATVTSSATDVVGSAKLTGTNEAVKVGQAAVTYTATVAAAGPVLLSGATVYFTLTTGVHTPVLTANGTLVSSTSTTKVYSAVTNSLGVASLIVTSDTTTAGTTYTVIPKSGTPSGSTLTATYAAAAASTIDNTNTAASLIVTPGTSVTLTGRLLDQFAGAYTPSGSDPVQVPVRIPAGGATAGQAGFSGSTFSYVYAPTTTPTAGTATSWDFNYDPTGLNLNGTDSSINWASTAAVGAVSISAPVAAATPTQQKGTLTPLAGTTVTGLVTDAASAVLAYKAVTLTGTDGVLFSTVTTPTTSATDDLVSSLTVAANGSGSYTGYAFFTKAGAATITVTSGTIVKTVDVVVTQASDPYKVIAVDTALAPGASSVVSGRVENAFGFPVSGAWVNLSLGSSTVAALGSSSVTTGSDGIWSTTVTGASDGDGAATLTATLDSQTANAIPHLNWLANAGVTIAVGSYQDSATITVDPNINRTTLMGPVSRAGYGKVSLFGKAKPHAAVEVYAKAYGTSQAYALVGIATANADGDWGDDEYIGTSTTFYAKTSVSSSTTKTVWVTASTVKPLPTGFSKLAATAAKGKAFLRVTGSARATATVYQLSSRRWVKITATKVGSNGKVTVTVKTSKGMKTYRVILWMSGRTATSRTVSVRVK